jgi:ABC-type lipoprotein export system ATPase subunit
MSSRDSLIELHDVVKAFVSPAGSFTALKDVNLQVDAGEFVAVIGKSGSGKSTLINMITGIDRPTSGEVRVGDTQVRKLSEGQLAVWRGRTIGLIFQFFQLLPTLTVAENVVLPMDFCHMYDRRERTKRAMELLEQVDLAEHADKMPAELSGGQQQRVAIARALANDPPILVADEPTGNLDSKSAASVFRMFERLAAQGKTILMVTHDRDLAQRATRTVILSDGQIIEEFLSRTFPVLSEDQLARLTRQVERIAFAPGEVIIREGQPPQGFYIVTHGVVEVHLRTSSHGTFVVSRMGAGQFVGEIELLRGGNSVATVRASADKGAVVAELDPSEFSRLLAESSEVRDEIAHLAEARFAENVGARGT